MGINVLVVETRHDKRHSHAPTTKQNNCEIYTITRKSIVDTKKARIRVFVMHLLYEAICKKTVYLERTTARVYMLVRT